MCIYHWEGGGGGGGGGSAMRRGACTSPHAQPHRCGDVALEQDSFEFDEELVLGAGLIDEGVGRRPQRLVDEQFDQTLLQYDSDEIGEGLSDEEEDDFDDEQECDPTSAAVSGSVDGDADDRGSEASATDDSLSEHEDVAEGGSALPSALEVRVWPLEVRQFPCLRVQAVTNPALARAACCE